MPRAERVAYGQNGMQQLFSVCSFLFSVQQMRQMRGPRQWRDRRRWRDYAGALANQVSGQQCSVEEPRSGVPRDVLLLHFCNHKFSRRARI